MIKGKGNKEQKKKEEEERAERQGKRKGIGKL